MSRIQLQDLNCEITEVQKIFDEITEKAGAVPPAYRAFGRLPHILQANWNRTKNILGQGSLPIEIKEAIATRVSAVNQCHFCLVIHKGNLEKLGISIEQIQAIEVGESANKKLNFVLRFVSTATKNPENLTDQDFSDLKQFGYSEEDILEILTVMEMYTGYNKIIVALNLQLEE